MNSEKYGVKKFKFDLEKSKRLYQYWSEIEDDCKPYSPLYWAARSNRINFYNTMWYWRKRIYGGQK